MGKNNPVLSLLGLCARGRNLVSGEFSVEKAVKEHKALMVIVAEDASENTKKSYSDMCAYYNVPLHFFGSKSSLGHAIGQEERAGIAILDEGMADGIAKKLKVVEATEVMNESK